MIHHYLHHGSIRLEVDLINPLPFEKWFLQASMMLNAEEERAKINAIFGGEANGS